MTPFERSFLTAGSAGFQGSSGSVQPDVDALDKVLRHMHVVVFEEGDMAPIL